LPDPGNHRALLAVIGIAGMNRGLQVSIIAKNGKAVETAGDIDTVLLDKTGMITMGNRRTTDFEPTTGYSQLKLALLAALASKADETRRERVLSRSPDARRRRAEVERAGQGVIHSVKCPNRMSSIDFADGRSIRKGPPEVIFAFVKAGGTVSAALQKSVIRSPRKARQR
jgi:K+-transporting ATPase ATPase B chain